MMTFVNAITAALAVATVNAHMTLKTPKPFNFGNAVLLTTTPLTAANYPCQLTGDPATFYSRSGATTMAVGEQQTLSFGGSAPHGGGSCQLAITSDLTPSKSTHWQVILSIEGGCPTTGSGSDASTYDYKIPEGVTPGSYTFAWTWVSKLAGQPEYYMNCAPIEVTGGAKKRSLNSSMDVETLMKRDGFPDLWVGNLKPINDCQTVLGSDPIYPNPGSNVLKPPGDRKLQDLSAGTPGTCCAEGKCKDGVSGGSSGSSGNSSSAAAPSSSSSDAGATMSALGASSQAATTATGSATGSAIGSATGFASGPATGSASGAATGVATGSASGLATSSYAASPTGSATASAADSVMTSAPTSATSSASGSPLGFASSASGYLSSVLGAYPSSAPYVNATTTAMVTSTVSAASVPAVVATGSASAPASAPAVAATGSSSSRSSSSSSTGGGMSGACTSEGMFNCVGAQYQQCGSGSWTALQAMPAGTTCKQGQSMTLWARSERRVRRGSY